VHAWSCLRRVHLDRKTGAVFFFFTKFLGARFPPFFPHFTWWVNSPYAAGSTISSKVVFFLWRVRGVVSPLLPNAANPSISRTETAWILPPPLRIAPSSSPRVPFLSQSGQQLLEKFPTADAMKEIGTEGFLFFFFLHEEFTMTCCTPSPFPLAAYG